MARSDTAVVGAATFASRLMGFARNAVVGALFGQTWKADVLNVVFSIPFNLRKLVAEGAMSTAFIPVLSRTIEEDKSGQRSKQLVRSMFTLQLLILVPLIGLAIVFAPSIVAVLAPFDTTEKQALAVDLFRWFILYLFLVSWSAVLMGVENTHQKFLIPAVSPILFSVPVIASLLVLAPSLGVYAQVPGVLVGGVLPVLLQWYGIKKLGYSMRPVWKFWTPDLRDMARKWGPALTVSGVALLNQQISMTLAATLPEEGSASALSNAIVFWQLPAGVLSASVVTVFFPRMSRQVARKDWKAASGTMVQGLELQALLLLPAGLLMALFAEPIVGLAFQRGEFTYENTVLAARVLSWLSWGLFLSGLFNFLQRYFYAKSDFRTPFRVSLIWAATDVAVSVTLMNTSLGVVGLAVGSVAGFGVGALVLLVLAWKDLPWNRLGSLAWFVVRIGVALVPVVLVWNAALGWTGPWWKDGMTLLSLGILLAEGLGGVFVFGLGLLVLGIRPWTLWSKKEGQE